MDLLEIYADARGETHFRRTVMDFEVMNYVPPSSPVHITPDMAVTTARFLAAPVGWDKEFHATPRRQLAVLLKGHATFAVSDGETLAVGPGRVILLNDKASKGHLTQVQDGEDALFLLIGLEG
ncbi:MAG: hypothetical protein KDJ46_07780 [Rhodobiaceae bacterium]|nr:hypothetical protein [Rhodobiaceae bacterium]